MLSDDKDYNNNKKSDLKIGKKWTLAHFKATMF